MRSTTAAAAPAGTPNFRTAVQTVDVIGRIAGGIDVFASNCAVFKLFYGGPLGETTTQQSAGIRASMPFWGGRTALWPL